MRGVILYAVLCCAMMSVWGVLYYNMKGYVYHEIQIKYH